MLFRPKGLSRWKGIETVDPCILDDAVVVVRKDFPVGREWKPCME